MATIKQTLTIGFSFRDAEKIAEVQHLHAEIAGTDWTRSEIYLMGLRQLAEMLKKAKFE